MPDLTSTQPSFSPSIPTSLPPETSQNLPPSSLPQLPSSFLQTSTPPTLITQGAEALLFRSTYLLPSIPCALKFRPSKPYRHPILDARLTKHRILSEARVLVKCRREGVCVPAVYAIDERRGWIMLEWIGGRVVRVGINEWIAGRRGRRGLKRVREEDEDGDGEEKEAEEKQDDSELVDLLARIGTAVGKLHAIGVVHGDLTTSNLMLRPWTEDNTTVNGATSTSSPTTSSELESKTLEGEVVLIDFGLASQSSADEDRAVDLYVLERAFGSTHPSAEGLFGEVLKSYGKSFKGANVVLKRLADVRMRGRKKSMIG